jgi:hypothetical protein
MRPRRESAWPPNDDPAADDAATFAHGYGGRPSLQRRREDMRKNPDGFRFPGAGLRMNACRGRGSHAYSVVLLALFSCCLLSCRRSAPPEPPVATATVTINRDRAPLGSPVDLTYKFVVSSTARFDGDYRVMVHVVDVDDQMIFALDHDPPVATSRWTPGQTIEYTRTEFIPIYPYVGEASVQIGLYLLATQQRLPLDGMDVGQRAYKVAALQLLPQTDNVYTVFNEGWHPAEMAGRDSTVEWQWTKRSATLSFKNPRKDSTLYLELDNPGRPFNSAQRVQVSIGAQVLDSLTVTPGAEPVLHRIPIPAAAQGNDDMVDLQIQVDKTFVPALLNAATKDPRELGVRVFHAFVLPSR